MIRLFSLLATRFSLLPASEVGPVFDWIIRHLTARNAENAKTNPNLTTENTGLTEFGID